MLNKTTAAKILMFFAIAILAGSCKKSCSSVVCHTYGYSPTLGTTLSEVCFNGYCACPNGLEGDSCKTFSINKYLQPSANWQVVSDPCSNIGSSYSVYISQTSSGFSDFYINGLFGGGALVRVTMASNTNHQGVDLYVPSQSTPNGVINSGNGVYQSNGFYGKITLNLDFTNNSGMETSCTLIMNQY